MSKYSGKTPKFKFLCSIIDTITETSICDSSQYDTLSNVIKNYYLDEPSSELNLASKPDIKGQIGVPQLVDEILGMYLACKLDSIELANWFCMLLQLMLCNVMMNLIHLKENKEMDFSLNLVHLMVNTCPTPFSLNWKGIIQVNAI